MIAPGIYDPLTALLAEQAGFEAAYVSGAVLPVDGGLGMGH